MWDSFSNYDAWKTACCDRYPNCKDCPYDDIDDEQEDDEEAEK